MNLVIFRPLCIDSGYLVSTTPRTILYRSFWNFAHVFSMVWRYACGLDIILALIFITFSTFWTLLFSTSDCMKMYSQCVPFKRNSLYNFILTFMQLGTSFFHGLKMCMWFGFNPGVNFCHFPTLLTLSFFKFSQVQHQLHRRLIYILIIFVHWLWWFSATKKSY